MIGQSGCHRRCLPVPAALLRIHRERERLDWTRDIVDPVFPGTRRPERVQLLGIGQSFAHQAPVHLTRCQVRPLHIGRMRTDQRLHGLRLTVDHLNRNPDQPTARTGFDDLKILPLRLGTFDGRWSADATVFRHLPPSFEECLPIITFPIRRHRWWYIRMPAVFELGHQLVGDHLLGLADRAPNPQARIGIQRYAAPEGAALVLLRAPPFSPLWPT
jgi:hypothetical protein